MNTIYYHHSQLFMINMNRISLIMMSHLSKNRVLSKLPLSFVLINADLGAEDDLLKDLRGIEFVKEVYIVYGVYDIVVKIEADTLEKVKETITWKIRRLEKVRSTLTMIVVDN